MPGEIKPSYLIAGSDERKIGAARRRLRQRAEREGGDAALQVFEPAGSGAPDASALLAAIPALSLVAARRYLLADHVERWAAGQAEAVAAAIGALPPDLTLVLVAHGKAPRKLVSAVEAAGGEILSYEAPRTSELAGWLVAEAERRGYSLDPAAARMLVERMGEGTVRLSTELDRLALWASPGGGVSAADLEEMIADTSEAASWALADAIVERRADHAVLCAERLAAQGESVTPLVYAVAKRLRQAARAVGELEAGRSPKEVAASLQMHPYAAKQLVRRVRGASEREMRDAIGAIADLELWTRGGSDYPEAVAITLAARRAAGAGAVEG